MNEHINEFYMSVDKLKEMEIANDLLTILLLYSIPESYKNFRIAIESGDELPSPDAQKVKLIEETNARKDKEIPTFLVIHIEETLRKRTMSVTGKSPTRRQRKKKQKQQSKIQVKM
ncbi:hypothetical protein AVEN_188660-1 [Araneus ventricosus]|uniref:Retrovirus-related Pol polyprotein from transposon TNT 1-94 n=1 Tax=Araneus ventricosus TaxID=182803 RepID=A0A4Y2KP80_ARAVE|nr:hypothetical protein AVEN_188660-1 [Araneus ventricosus]